MGAFKTDKPEKRKKLLRPIAFCINTINGRSLGEKMALGFCLFTFSSFCVHDGAKDCFLSFSYNFPSPPLENKLDRATMRPDVTNFGLFKGWFTFQCHLFFGFQFFELDESILGVGTNKAGHTAT